MLRNRIKEKKISDLSCCQAKKCHKILRSSTNECPIEFVRLLRTETTGFPPLLLVVQSTVACFTLQSSKNYKVFLPSKINPKNSEAKRSLCNFNSL